MATNATQLADEIRSAMGFPLPVSPQLIGWATGVLDELTSNGSATFGGMAGGHPISGMTGSSMASKVAAAAGYPSVTSELENFCTAIVDHIESDGIVTYIGPVPPTMPDWFLGGTISGLDGSALAVLVKDAVGYPSVTSELETFCTAFTDHIMNNAEVESGVIS